MPEAAVPDTADEPAGPVPKPGQAMLRALLALVAAEPHALTAILDGSGEGLIAFGPDRLVLHANRAAETLFGYGPGELEGTMTDLLAPERMRQGNAPVMAPLADIMQLELPGLRRDGREISVEWALGCVVASAGPVFVMSVRDRAAIDTAIAALRASEERFRLLVDGARDYAMFTLDPAGHVSSWNEGARRMTGWSPAEIVGKPYEVFFTPEDREAGVPARHLQAALESDGQVLRGVRVRRDGSRFEASANLTPLRAPTGELRGFAKITRDLTETFQSEELERRLIAERARREAAEDAEKRLRASEERMRRLQHLTAALSEAATPGDVAAVVLGESLQTFEASGGAVYLLSPDGGSLHFLDQRGHDTKLLAYYPTMPLGDRTPIADAARARTPLFFESFAECASSYPHLREGLGSSGFEAAAALPLVAHGALLGVLGIRFLHVRSFDASDQALLRTVGDLCAQALDRARLFAAESRARADAEAASRAKDEFLAMLGHELRNPLAPIVTALSLMKRRSAGTLEKEREVIERQVKHLVHLVDDLLDVSRITQGKVALKKERVELGAVVQRAVELSSPLLERNQHHLSVLVPAHGLEVVGDSTRLAQVISNLLTNAAKYTQRGGHIEVVASRHEERVALTVKDDGVGIGPAMLSHVFELFAQERQSIDRSQGGLGLGLAIVKSLMAMHDGTVSATSAGPGKGSSFTITLPAARSEAPLEAPAHLAGTPPPRAATTGRRVLVVDDNPDAAELLADVLRVHGHEARIAHDGPVALRVAAAFNPEVALLDIGLPVMDGYELARKLRHQMGSVRLIAVTGYGQDADRQRAREAGFDAHMIKPIEVEALRLALG